MKMTTMSNLSRRALALALAVVLAVPTAYAAAGEKKLQTSAELVQGLTYHNTVTVNAANRVESFSMELEQGSDAYPIILQASGTMYGAATINRAVTYAQSLGYHVLGAINTDYFSLSSGVPIGIVIEDGVYKSSPEGAPAMLITDGRVTLSQTPKVDMMLTNQRSGAQTMPHHLNKLRNASGGLYVLNSDFSAVSTRTSGSGWYVRMKVVEGNLNDPMGIWNEAATTQATLGVNSTLTLEVVELLQSDQPTAIGAGEYILTSDDRSGYGHTYQDFQLGDIVTLTTTCQDAQLSAAQWAGGTGDVMAVNGQLTDSSKWIHVAEGRAPRTALGVKRDGTLLVYAVDGRQTGYSSGLSQKDLAEEMVNQGCEWVVNLDGGGSTAISVWVPGQAAPSVRNIPSDGALRGCATYLLLVTDDTGTKRAERLAMQQDGLVVLAGTSVTLPDTVVLDDRLNLLSGKPGDLTITSEQDLGDIKENIYTAGNRAGTDTVRLRSRDLDVEGSAQIHVVEGLTALTVTRKGSSTVVSKLSLKPGETVQLAVTGSYWGRLAMRDLAAVSWSVSDGVGTVDENGLFTAATQGALTGSITVSAGGLKHTIQVTPYNVHLDVTEDHWAYKAVQYCYANGIVSGISATEFGRDHQIRRGDFMLMLYNALGKPATNAVASFTDVSPSDYYFTALSWGQGAGLASGMGGGAYSPTAPVTREQAFTILRQAMPLMGKDCPTGSLTVLDQFADKDMIADYAKGHTATLVAQGVVSGKGTGIDPKGNLTRAEMAVLLHKLLTYTPIQQGPQPEVPVEPEQPTQPDPSEFTLALSKTNFTLKSGESYPLTATLTPAWEGAEITWSSDSPSCAAVTNKGEVTNLFPGTGTSVATITASWNGLSASSIVYCNQADMTGIVVNAEKGLNVRSGPGTDNAVVGSLTNGAQLVVLGVENGWCHILYLSKTNQAAIGYVSTEYIQLSR